MCFTRRRHPRYRTPLNQKNWKAGIDMNHRHISDWCTLDGANVEIRQQGTVVCSGTVDGVTDDGSILWVLSPIDGRRLFEKAAYYQAWAVEERLGFHYKVNLCEPGRFSHIVSCSLRLIQHSSPGRGFP